MMYVILKFADCICNSEGSSFPIFQGVFSSYEKAKEAISPLSIILPVENDKLVDLRESIKKYDSFMYNCYIGDNSANSWD